MSNIIIKKSSNPDVAENFYLMDDCLSLKAKGILTQMLTIDMFWGESVFDNLTHFNNESERTIYTAIRELENEGYLERYQDRDENGHLLPVEYMICDKPYGWIDRSRTGTPTDEPPQDPNLQEVYLRMLDVFDEFIEILHTKKD